MEKNRLSAKDWWERIVLALLFAGIGTLTMVVFSPWRPLLDRVNDYLGRLGLILLLLIVTWLVRRSRGHAKYWQVFFGLFVMAVAVSLDRVISIYVVDYMGLHDTTPAGWALLKLNECAVIVCVIILFSRISGASLGSIYLQKGNLKLGLSIGLIAFLICAAGAIPTSALLFKGHDLTLARILPWTPWVLIFVLANASLEELLFRGLFLQRLEPFYGKFLSVFLIAFVFTLLHQGATYTSQEFFFLVVLFPLALALGTIVQKTGGLWGSILLHAGMDLPLILGVYSNLA
jgi:membrane protease YdiL (CAAX protease family)